jgi:N-acetyl-gamma-glutamyl-phosphate reductase
MLTADCQEFYMINVSIVGATGYTGGELLRWLKRHPKARVTHVTSGSSAGKKLEDVHPSLRGTYDLTLEDFHAQRLARDCDVAFFALPHGAAGRSVAEFLDAGGPKAIDLSADFRLKDVKTYAEWYKTEHASSRWLRDAVYGLPELHRKSIRPARLVANPGCYATASILALTPLLKAGLVKTASIVVDAKSGVSGAGRKMEPLYHFSEASENLQAYAVAAHRHTPEIEQEVSREAKTKVVLTFVPHLVPMNRGILVAAYMEPKKALTPARAREVIARTYHDEPFIRLLPEGVWPQTRAASHTNYCDINATVDRRTGRVIVMAALDNLVKGASGQAIQNMNLLFGFRETEGLL